MYINIYILSEIDVKLMYKTSYDIYDIKFETDGIVKFQIRPSLIKEI